MKNILLIGLCLAVYAVLTALQLSVTSASIVSLLVLLAAAAACYHMQGSSAAKVRVETKVVGITGTIASGKSLVGNLLEELGVPVLDTDHIGHDVQKNDQEVRAALRKRFGDGVFKANGDVDRKALGRIVFNDRAALNDLNGIIHPAIMRECRRRIAALGAVPLVAVQVPLLFEAGLENEYDEIWTVTASDAVVRERLKARDGISDEEATKRINAQFPQQKKIEGSDYVIDNSGTIDDTRRQVVELLKIAR